MKNSENFATSFNSEIYDLADLIHFRRKKPDRFVCVMIQEMELFEREIYLRKARFFERIFWSGIASKKRYGKVIS